MIPKPGGDERALGIPSIRTIRIFVSTVQRVLAPSPPRHAAGVTAADLADPAMLSKAETRRSLRHVGRLKWLIADVLASCRESGEGAR
jgi:hypothetical protein